MRTINYKGINDLVAAQTKFNRTSDNLVLIRETKTTFQFEHQGKIHKYIKIYN